MNITITFIGIYYLLLSEYCPGLEQEDPHSPPRPLWAYKLPGFLLITVPSKLDTLEFQIDHTVGKNLHGWKTNIDKGAKATEMCPDIKAIGIWLAAIENL